MAGKGGRYIHLQRKPGGGRIKLGADDADDTRLLQPANAVQRRRGGQSGKAGEFDVGPIRVGLQRGEKLNVNIVKLNCHTTKYCLV
jgi:hypothetical protein